MMNGNQKQNLGQNYNKNNKNDFKDMIQNLFQNQNGNGRNINNKNNINYNGNNNVWCNHQGVKIYNCNDGNKNIGNGNGILDKRAMGFPLERSIIDVNGFVVDNMYFKDVTVFHKDTCRTCNNNQNN